MLSNIATIETNRPSGPQGYPESPSPKRLERDRLIESHMYLVHAAAGRMKKSYGKYLSVDELVGYGIEGLIEAVDRFDPSRGASFATFSFYRIRDAMLDGLRRAGWYSRYDIARFNAAKLRAERAVNELMQSELETATSPPQPAAGKAAILASIEDTLSQIATVHITSLDFVHAKAEEGCAVSEEALHLTDESLPSADQMIDLQAVSDRIRATVAGLPTRERRLIELHYFGDHDLQDAGATLGLSKWSTSRLHGRAVRLLRAALATAEDPR